MAAQPFALALFTARWLLWQSFKKESLLPTQHMHVPSSQKCASLMTCKIKTFTGYRAKTSPLFPVIVSSLEIEIYEFSWISGKVKETHIFFLQLLKNSSANADSMWAQQLIFTEKHVLFNHVTSTRVAENTMFFYSTSITIQWIYSVSHGWVQPQSKNRFVEENQLNSLFSSLINYMPCFSLNNEKNRYCYIQVTFI